MLDRLLPTTKYTDRMLPLIFRVSNSTQTLTTHVQHNISHIPCWKKLDVADAHRFFSVSRLGPADWKNLCAPANNKRPCGLLRLINQTNATGGTKHVCKRTWAFLTCLPVYMAGAARGFVYLCECVWPRANVLYGRCQRKGLSRGTLGDFEPR